MTPPSVSGEHLDAVREELNLSFSELWFRYVAVGGARSLPGLISHLRDGRVWPLEDHVYVVAALNDFMHDLGMGQPLRYPDRPPPGG